MEEKRMLIERYLPVEEISEEAKLEKLGNAKPPMSSIHYWWTRKPLVASRAVVLASLLPSDFDITSFKRLIGLGRSERAHNYNLTSNEIEILKQKYIDVWGKIPTILDPFGGGGAIAFEALRVGVNTLSNDYNPVAYLIQKATLEYPKKYGLKLYKEVEKGLTFIFNETQKEMDKYYPQHDGVNATAYIWCWVVRCPSCGFLSPLVGQWWLARSKNKKIYMDPSIENSDLIIRLKKDPPIQNVTL
jgi:adenine-specific DNA methylase